MPRELTVTQTRFTWQHRVANTALSLAHAFGWRSGDLTVEAFLEEARAATGLDDFGDPHFQVGMKRLLDNVRDLDLPPLSRELLRGSFVQGLHNRLRSQAHLNAHPEILHIPLERPVFVLGFPRTGTTLLQNLLALHPDRRALQFWELYTPMPLHDDPVVSERRRRWHARLALWAATFMAPEMRHVHDVRVDTYEECWYLFWNSMQVLNWDIISGLHDYGRWLLHDNDMTGAYREYRQWLQMLLHREPTDQLVLKCPEHLWFVDDLLEVFPDACIIWTHRDPVASVASYCSLMSLTRRTMYGRVDPSSMGRNVAERFLEGVTRAMDARDAWGREDTFYDVDFLELVEDPEAMLKKICEHFGMDWCADYGERIAAWQASDRDDKRGNHVYSTEQFHLDPEAIQRDFARYIDRFQIPIKAEPV